MGTGSEKRWVLPGVTILGALCLVFIAGRLGTLVSAQAEPQPGGYGNILAVPVQIGRDSYGLAMVDMATQTLWVYEVNSRGPAHKRLTLLAARSWRYDRLLQRYNTDEPTPEQVRMLLQNLGRLQEQKEQSEGKERDSGTDILEMAEP
jgi:hypothetical protein